MEDEDVARVGETALEILPEPDGVGHFADAGCVDFETDEGEHARELFFAFCDCFGVTLIPLLISTDNELLNLLSIHFYRLGVVHETKEVIENHTFLLRNLVIAILSLSSNPSSSAAASIDTSSTMNGRTVRSGIDVILYSLSWISRRATHLQEDED